MLLTGSVCGIDESCDRSVGDDCEQSEDVFDAVWTEDDDNLCLLNSQSMKTTRQPIHMRIQLSIRVTATSHAVDLRIMAHDNGALDCVHCAVHFE